MMHYSKKYCSESKGAYCLSRVASHFGLSDSYNDCQWSSNANFTEYITAVRMSSFSSDTYFILFIQLLQALDEEGTEGT